MSEDVPSHHQDAPGRLNVIRTFVNTLDVEGGVDDLDTPEALVDWLREQELLDDGAEATRADLRRAVALREAFREVLLGNHGGYESDPAATATLEDAARRARLEVRFTADGTPAPSPPAAASTARWAGCSRSSPPRRPRGRGSG